MKIALCMICKGDSELPLLKNCINTVKDYVDGVFITANSKETKETEKYCKENKFNYSYLKWNSDFSEQRNFNFKQVKGYDWILWLDSDDEVVNGQFLRPIAEESLKNHKDIVFFEYWYGCSFNGEPTLKNLNEVEIMHMRERLIKPETHTWKGMLHETPVPIENFKSQYSSIKYSKDTPIAILHTDIANSLEDKMIRNRTILEAQLKKERDKGEADPRTLLYLMKIYVESNQEIDLINTIEMGKEYISKSGWDEERGVASEIIGTAYVKLNDLLNAINWYHRSIQEWPHNPMSYLRLASAYYDANKYRESVFWYDLGMSLPIDTKTGNIINLKAMKILASEMAVKINFNVKKDVEKSFKSADLLYKENPTDNNLQNVMYLEDLNELEKACKHTDQLFDYIDKIDKLDIIPNIINALPEAISNQPFCRNWIKRTLKPRKWGDKEICYFANFGSDHFEKWDGNSLKSGIGGSETAVIRLSEEWTKKGYKVTVYGDPEKECVINGVTYLPWYYFNITDEFNIFIQWRGNQLAGQVKCKKFLIDLHDIYSPLIFNKENLKHTDKIMVKSNYHRDLAPEVSNSKFEVISNGI